MPDNIVKIVLYLYDPQVKIVSQKIGERYNIEELGTRYSK